MNEVKRENRAKLNLKYATCAHISKDTILVYCEKIDSLGIKTTWDEICPNDIKIRLQSGKKYNAKYIYINENLVGLLKDITVIEFYPNNEGYDCNYNVKSIILRTKKASLSFNNYVIEGKSYNHCDISILNCNENLLFN